MTSKEALNDLIDEIKHTHNNGKTLTEYDQKRTDIIAKDLEVLETFRKILKENHNAQRIDDCVFAKSDTETFFGLGDYAIIVKNEDVEKIEHWFYRGE